MLIPTHLEQVKEAADRVKVAADALEEQESLHQYHTKMAANVWDEIIRTRRALTTAESSLVRIAKSSTIVAPKPTAVTKTKAGSNA